MLNNLLAILPNENGNWYFDNFIEPLVYAVIGYLVVFLGIVIIIGVIWLVGFLMKKTNNFAFLTESKPKKEKVTQKQEVTPAQKDDGEIPDEVKVVIVAAIMAYYEQEKPKCEFTVKRIKRI
ncbi:MAG: OadG family protein [Clostridia bacterium]|nr:OadG family protein [Clostridia bacterium]